jgi:hypothetical protein
VKNPVFWSIPYAEAWMFAIFMTADDFAGRHCLDFDQHRIRARDFFQ